MRPVRATALYIAWSFKAFALTGRGYRPKQPRAMPWAKSFCPFRACGAYLRNLNYKKITNQKLSKGEKWQ